LKQLYILKKYNRYTKVLLSIGRWIYSINFASAASIIENRDRFIFTAIIFLGDLGFNSIDIDWEYLVNNTNTSNFVLLLVVLRFALDDYKEKYTPGYYFLFNITSPARLKNYNILYLNVIDKYLDI
jgi:chitinase